jgi:hypothetical protein
MVVKKTIIATIDANKHDELQRQDVLDIDAHSQQRNKADVGKGYNHRVAEWTTQLALMIAIHPFMQH